MLVIVGCSGGGPISGNFVLSPYSSRPAWFKSSQSKLQFKIDVYETTFTSIGDVRITVLDSQGKMIEQVKGKWQWHPETITRPSTQYPKWILIKVGNTSEIYEQVELTNALNIVQSVPSDKKQTAPNTHTSDGIRQPVDGLPKPSM